MGRVHGAGEERAGRVRGAGAFIWAVGISTPPCRAELTGRGVDGSVPLRASHTLVPLRTLGLC